MQRPDPIRSAQPPDGTDPTQSHPAVPDHGENSASTLVEAPRKGTVSPLEAHDFPDGGGSGGASAFSRRRVRPRRS